MSALEGDPFAGSGILGVLDADDRDYLTQRSRRMAVGKGQVIISEGEPSNSVLVLLTGALKVVTYSLEGDEFIVNTILPGETVGEMGVLSGRPRSATVQATVPSTVLVLPKSVIFQLIEERPVLAIALLRRLSNMVSRVTGVASDLVHLDLSQRVAKYLVEKTSGPGRSDSLRLTQSELASTVGASRQRVNNCLRDFQKNGWIELASKQVTVLEKEALLELVNS